MSAVEYPIRNVAATDEGMEGGTLNSVDAGATVYSASPPRPS